MTQCSVATARDELTRLIREAESGEPVHITRRGNPVAVLISEAEYQRMSRKASRQKGFGELIQEMRTDPDFEPVDLTREEIESWRDRSPGRDFSWEE